MTRPARGGKLGARICLLLLVGIALELGADSSALASDRTTLGVVIDGPWARRQETVSLFVQEVQELAKGEFDVEVPPSKVVTGDWTRSGIGRAIDQMLADPEVDIVIGLGPLASDLLCRRGPLPKPAVATAVIDAELQGLPMKAGASGVKNLAYLAIPSAIERDLRALRELAPFEHLVVLSNRYLSEAIPQLAAQVSTEMRTRGIEGTLVPVGSSAGEALAMLPPNTDAAYVWPLLQLSEAGLDSVIAGLNSRRLPTLSALGEREVRRGMLASVTVDIMPQLTRRVAVTIHRILRGEDPGTLPTAFAIGEHLVINLDTARTIGRFPRWSALAEAETIGDERADPKRRLSLVETMQLALSENRSLAAKRLVVASGRESVRKARARLLPQGDASLTQVWIDEDRAASSLGSHAERTLTGSLSVQQWLLSEPSLANLSIEKSQQEARVREAEELELDVARSAATAYINVLRALVFERIQKENLRLTRDHLELARTREAAGAAGVADVYRWESELATNRKSAIEANASRNLAEMELCRILHLPLETALALEEITLDGTDLLTGVRPALRYFEDKESFRGYRDFVAEEALRRSPELKQIDAGLDAATRRLSSSRRSFWLPEIGVQGSLDRELSSSGAGSKPNPLLANLGPSADETNWSIGLSATLPLLRGGGRIAETRQAGLELSRLRQERADAAEQIEQRVRAGLHQAGASYAGIAEARLAMEAARKNLDLVGDAYSRGALSLIDLLDAQNSFIVAEEAAANATNEFLLDIVDAERAGGRFEFLASSEERAAFQQRLEAFLNARAVDR